MDLNWLDSKIIQQIKEEANELLAIFTTIGKKLKL